MKGGLNLGWALNSAVGVVGGTYDLEIAYCPLGIDCCEPRGEDCELGILWWWGGGSYGKFPMD